MLPWSSGLWFSTLFVGPRVVCCDCGCVLWFCAVVVCCGFVLWLCAVNVSLWLCVCDCVCVCGCVFVIVSL